jgi:hypothetical protein
VEAAGKPRGGCTLSRSGGASGPAVTRVSACRPPDTEEPVGGISMPRSARARAARCWRPAPPPPPPPPPPPLTRGELHWWSCRRIRVSAVG